VFITVLYIFILYFSLYSPQGMSHLVTIQHTHHTTNSFRVSSISNRGQRSILHLAGDNQCSSKHVVVADNLLLLLRLHK
jgi:hypothetical protein